jgi:hypothetical protein
MAKKKKRGRVASPEAAGAVGIEAPAREPEAVAGETAPAPTPRAGDRFDPFGSPRARLLSNVFIALFLAYMLGMPLRYYLGGRGLDERFSWRMFSSVRMLKCKVEVDEHVDKGGDVDERSVSLTKEVQVAWIGLLERGRPLVIEKLLTRRCAQEGVVQVDYHLTCKAPDGSDGPGLDHHMKCSDGTLAAGRGEL